MRALVKITAGLLAAAGILIAVYVVLNWAPDRPLSELKARWAPSPSVFVDIAGMSVHLRDEGPRDGPTPIVLLHGTSASLHTWEGWTRALVEKRRVIRFDLPGFGLTGPAPDNDYTIRRYAAFVVALLDKLEVRRCVLAGNSFGGYVAWVTALTAPERVDKLVLIDAGGYPQQPTSVPVGFRIAQVPILNKLAQFTLPRSVIEFEVCAASTAIPARSPRSWSIFTTRSRCAKGTGRRSRNGLRKRSRGRWPSAYRRSGSRH